MSKHRHISFPERLRLEGLLLAEAARIKGQADLLGNLDEEVLNLARQTFSDEREFVAWAATPIDSLGGQTPLSALGSEAGRKSVLAWLVQVEDGGYL